jgi:Peptidase family M28
MRASACVAILALGCGDSTPGLDLATAPPPDLSATIEGLVADPEIGALASSVDSQRIAATQQTLVGFVTRNTCSDDSGASPGIGAARDWIRGQLAAIPGVKVQLVPFTYAGCIGGSITRENVVATIAGAHPERLVVVGGHYDSRTVDGIDPTAPAPGANDSGSQTALVIEAARALAGHGFDATLVLVAFAGEEQGLIGSKALAAGLGNLFPGATVEAMLNCDIVGGDSTVNDAAALATFRLYSPGTPREIMGPDGTTDDTSPSRGVMRYVGAWGGLYVPAMAMAPKLREDRMGRGGDHEAFIARGRPGVRFIEPNENLAHQHTGDDLFAYVTPAYTARVAAVVIATAASLARAPSAPGSLAVTGTAARLTLRFSGDADHYVVAARPASENLYRQRLRIRDSSTVSAADLGVAGAPFYVSVAAVDRAGHESLFAYPEYRCDDTGCAVPADALDVTKSN